jgi:hypothetical protein
LRFKQLTIILFVKNEVKIMKLTKLNLLIAVGLVLLFSIPAQSQFVKTLGGSSDDYGECVIQGSDRGFIVTGYTSSFGAGSYDLLLVNFDSLGNLLLTRTLGGTATDEGRSVIQASDGSIVVVGYTNSFGAGGNDLLLAKFTYWGTLLWARTLGGSGTDEGYSVVEVSGGGLVVAGYTNSFGAGEQDLLLAKFNSSGTHLWTKTLGRTEYDHRGYSVAEASDGGLVVTGYTESSGGYSDLLLTKFNASGTHLWTKTLGGISGEEGRSVIEASDGGFVVTGYTRSFGAGARDILLAKFDSSGNYLWTRTLGGSSSEYGYSVVEASDGGFVVAGYTSSFGAGSSDVLLAKFDASGNDLWTRVLGGSTLDEGWGVVEVSGGGLVATGRTDSYGAGGRDILFAKLNASGNTCLGNFVTCTVRSVVPPISSPSVTETSLVPTITIPPVTVGSHSPDTTTVCKGSTFIRGDVDCDGLVSWLDLWYIYCYVSSHGPQPPCWDAADVKDNGVVDAEDLIYLLNYLVANGPLPHPPFPEPGFDPTPDTLDCASGYIAPAPSSLDSLIVLSASGSAGQVIAVPIIVRNSQALLSYQIHLEFDPNILQVTGVDTTGTVTGTTDPGQFGFASPSEGMIDIWCYIDCQRLRSIPAGRHTLLKIMFQVGQNVSCAATLLDLKTVTGPPFAGNLLDYSGGKVYPTLVDSNFTAGRVYPQIDSIADVGNDQGKQVRVEWFSSCYDGVGLADTITQYSLWRRAETYKSNTWDTEYLTSRDIKVVESIDDMLAQVSQAKPGDRFLVVGDKGSTGIVWVFITTVPAMQFEQYAYDAPTECDSTIAGICWSVFFVAAHTANPTVHFDSAPDSGYSLDNIPPLPIRNMVVNPNSWFTLTWTVPGEYEGEHPISTYDIRYNTVPVGQDTQAWWDSVTACTTGEEFFYFIVGKGDSLKVAKDCLCHPEVYFAIKGLDDRPNYSEISNIARFQCGDASGDGVVDASDLVYLLNYLFASGPPPNPLAVGDVTCDGIVDISDVVYLLNYLFIHGPQPCGS